MRVLKAVILDFDGVVIESNDLKTQAFGRVFSRFPDHYEAMMAFHHANVFVTRFVKFHHLVVERLGRPEGDPLLDELARDFSRETQARLSEAPLVPGAQAFLERVSAAVPVYLASVTPQQELESLLAARGLSRYFTGIYGCPPWNKPAAIADILAAVGGADDVIFVGDSAGDQRAAAATGVEFIARDSGLPFDAPRPRAFPDMAAIAREIETRLPAGGPVQS